MTDEHPIRVWIDDPNPIFRLGLVACLKYPGFALAGESSSFDPEPDLDRVDALVFDLGKTALGEAIRRSRDTAVRLVAIARGAEDELLGEAVGAGVPGVLVRSEISPQSLMHCLRSVSGGNTFLPAPALANLLGGPAGSRRASLAGDLTGRQLDVLRLLSKGENTRKIAEDLCYSEKTVKNIVHDLLIRMNCRNRAQAVALATRRGLI